MMAISIICGFLPTFLISPFAGVWADRFNRKKLIMLSDSLIALATLFIAILFFAGYDAIWMLFVVSGIRALGTGIQTPAVRAFLPQLVPEDKLTKVNGVNSSIQSLLMLVSPMLSGVLLTLSAIEIIFFIDVITATIAVMILLLFLHVPAHSRALAKQISSYFNDMREGFNYIRTNRYIMALFGFIAAFFVFSAPLSFLTPLQITRSFGDDVWRLTAVQITYSVGMMAGGIILASWNGFRSKIHSMSLSILVVGVCTFVLGVIPDFWAYLILIALIGIVLTMIDTQFVVLLQMEVEEDYLGRVFSVLGMIQSLIMPLAMLMYGPLADFFKMEWLFMGTGLMIFIISLFMFSNKVLIQAVKSISKT